MRLSNSMLYLRRMNWAMAAVAALLLVVGICFVYSSCFVRDDLPVRSLYLRQILWVAVGVAGYFAAAFSDYRDLGKYAWWFYGGCLVLLVLVLFFGSYVCGARRRLEPLGISVQPSELAKLAMIVVLAHVLSRARGDLASPRYLLGMGAVILAPVALIVQQPDLGTAMVFIPVAMVMMFVAGVPWRILAVPVGLGLIGVLVLLGALLLPELLGVSEESREQIWGLTRLSEYQRARIEVFLGLDQDPLGVGWNKRQSEIAVGSGGFWGKGYLRGDQNILGFLPRSVAPTDFIFSVIAEEKGFVGSLVVLLLFGILLTGAMRVAVNGSDGMGRLLCTGIAAMLFCHVFINVAMTVGLMPITGLPLPFLSYGGSFMVVVMASLGIVQSVYIRSRRVRIL